MTAPVSQDEIVTEAVAVAIQKASSRDGKYNHISMQQAQHFARAAITAMRAASQERGDDDAEWLRHLITLYADDLGEYAVERLEAIANRLQAKAPETAKTLASEGRCHCGFWPCPTHQIDDTSEAPETGEG